MKISKLEQIILHNSSKVNLNRAKHILNNKDLLKFNISKINNVYNIYGNFKSENKLQTCNTHLKIDFVEEKIIFAKCNCSMFSEIHYQNKTYLCEHLIATVLMFVEEVKKKLNNRTTNKDKFRIDKNILNELNFFRCTDSNNSAEEEECDLKYKRNKLEINVSISEVKENNSNCFDVSFFVGTNNMYSITNIKEWAESIINSKEYYIGKGLVYTPKKYYFSKADEELLEYIYEYTLFLDNENNERIIRIPNEILRRFLEKLLKKKIKLNYNYQTYITEVKAENVPLSFTLKQIKDNYILTTKKIFPIPLNEKMNVFFFDRKLFIPNKSQIEIYKIFYKHLKESGKIIFYNDTTIEELNKIISSLKLISDNLILDISVIEKIRENFKIDFKFKKGADKYICDVSFINDKEIISYCDALKSHNDIISDWNKIRIIESELNKYSFFYRDDTFVFLGNDDDYYDFLKHGKKSIQKIGSIKINDNEKYFSFRNGNISEFFLQENEDGKYDFTFNLEGVSKEELCNVVDAYRNKKSYIKLNDNTFINLGDASIIDTLRMIESLNIDVSDKKDTYELELGKIYYLNEKLNGDIKKIANSKETISNALEKLNEIDENNSEIPKKFNGRLREYQIKGYNWFKNLSYLGLGGILGDEMGLGKTIQTIVFLASKQGKHSLIITPTSLIYNWKEEFNKFAPSLSVGIVHGNKNERKKVLDNIQEYDVLLTTYGTLRNDCLEYENIKFDYCILDEGQNINNPKAETTKIVKNINSKSRFILTGTPIENNLLELWSLFDFIMPGYLYSKEEFSNKFIKKDKENLDDLKILIRPYILRRIKKDVIKELPDKIEKKFLVELSLEQKKLYRSFIKDVQSKLQNPETRGNNMTIFSYLTRLRQICLDPSIIIDDYLGESAKLNVAKDLIIKNIFKHKILLFSQFTTVLKRMEKELKQEKIDYCYIDGSTSSKNRIKFVEEFNTNEQKRVFLISLKAGGTGLNLTSADMVIHFDPWWNPSVEEQATDRAHRIGQKHIVEVIKLIAKDTIEEKIMLLQEDKKILINNIITEELEDINIASALKSEQLLDLLLN